MNQHVPATDTVEISEVMRTLRRQWRAVIGFTVLGTLGALAVLAFAPRLYEGRASVLVKAQNESGASLLSRLGNMGEMLGAGGLGGRTPLETELQVMNSRALAGEVVDSLELQVRVMSPTRTRPSDIVTESALSRAFAPVEYTFERNASGSYDVRGDEFSAEVTSGGVVQLPQGTLTLADSLPEQFEVRLYDREEAITRLKKRLEAGKAGGDVASIIYKGSDSLTAAEVPNALVAFYLERRRTTDRGTNQKRVEFLTGQVDSTSAELASAERALRLYQEQTGVIDAEVVGKLGLEQAAALRKSLIEVEVEEGAVRSLLAQADAGRINGRQLASTPAFLRGASLNALVAQLGELEAERLRLLERRTEADPEVIALTQSIQAIEGQFVPMARSYAAALGRQRQDLSAQLDSMQRAMMAFPAAAEIGGRLQRDVLRLSQIYAALQAQLVQARLGAIDEGGEVRQLDTAVPPRKPWFPRPVATMGIGITGGLVSGLIAALILGWFGRWVRDTREIERATGVPAQRLQVGAPLMVHGGVMSTLKTVLVIPVEDRARAAGRRVAEQLVYTAATRAVDATVLDLSSGMLPAHAGGGNGNGASASRGLAGEIDALEQRHGLVVVQLPGLVSEATMAALRETRPVLLVAPSDRVDRTRLVNAVDTLRRLQVPVAGVVIGDTITKA